MKQNHHREKLLPSNCGTAGVVKADVSSALIEEVTDLASCRASYLVKRKYNLRPKTSQQLHAQRKKVMTDEHHPQRNL